MYVHSACNVLCYQSVLKYLERHQFRKLLCQSRKERKFQITLGAHMSVHSLTGEI